MAEEITSLDHIKPPYAVHIDHIAEPDVPLAVTSMGHFREGIHFNQFLYGYDNYQLTLTLDGMGEKKFRSIPREIMRGDVIFCNNYEPVYTRTLGEKWDVIFFNIIGHDLKLYEKLWNDDGFEIIHLDRTDFFEEYFEQIDALIDRSDLSSRLEISELLTKLISRCLMARESLAEQSALSGPAWVQDAKKYISIHCSEDIRMKDIADRFYMDRMVFARLFKKHVGKSPKEFQMYCRIDSAAILLRTTDMTISEIAAETGFPSHSAFSKHFYKIYGATPSDWRRMRITNGDK